MYRISASGQYVYACRLLCKSNNRSGMTSVCRERGIISISYTTGVFYAAYNYRVVPVIFF